MKIKLNKSKFGYKNLKNKSANILAFQKKKDRIYFVLGIFIILITSLEGILKSLIYGKIFQKLNNFFENKYEDQNDVIYDMKNLCKSIILIGFFKMFFVCLSTYLWTQLGEFQQLRARKQIVDIVINQTMLWFDLKKKLFGDLCQMNRNIEELRKGVSEKLELLLENIFSIFCLFILSIYQSLFLTCIFLSVFPLMIFLNFFFGKLIFKTATTENHLNSRVSQITNWTLKNVHFVRLFNATKLECFRFNTLVDFSFQAKKKLIKLITFNTMIQKFLFFFMYSIGFCISAHLIKTKKLEIQQSITCFSSCFYLGFLLLELSQLLNDLSISNAALDKIVRFLNNNLIKKFNNSQNLKFNLRFNMDIVFKNVSFKYENKDDFVLENVSFVLKKEKTNFIIGLSGLGKSTIVKLIIGLYKPFSGSIFIDNYDLNTIDKRIITNNITFIEKNCDIFDLSLKNNVAIATFDKYKSWEKIPNDLINKSCFLADLTDSFDSSQLGNKLISPLQISDSQNQKISLARAIIKDTEILIIDEAFNTFSIENKLSFIKMIRKFRENRTTIIVTHDYDLINTNDYVVLIKDRNKVEHGLFMNFEKKKIDSSKKNENIDGSFFIKNKSNHFEKLEKKLFFNNEYKNILSDKKSTSRYDYNLKNFYKFCINTLTKKKKIVFGLSLSFIETITKFLFSICFSKLLSYVLKGISNENNFNNLIKWSIIFTFVSLINCLCNFFSSFLLSNSGENWILFLKKKVFLKIIEQDISFFESNNNVPNELTSLLMNDTMDLRILLSDFLPSILNIVSLISFVLLFSFFTEWKLTLLSIFFLSIIIISSALYSKILETTENNYKNVINNLENLNYQITSTIKTIKVLNLESYFLKKFENNLEKIQKASKTRSLFTGFSYCLNEFFISVFTASILFYGICLMVKQNDTKESLIEVITILKFVLQNTSTFVYQLPELSRIERTGHHINNLICLDNDEKIKSKKTYPSKEFKLNSITFKNLSFSYPMNYSVNIFNGLTLNIMKNKLVVLIGKSGSGKTTISKLLFKIYKVKNDSIYINECDINELDNEWIRKYIAIVPQNFFFFEGTIYDNLLYGNSNEEFISDEMIYKVLIQVNLYTFIISLPDGLNTLLSQNSHFLLSSGQLQRLSVARAILRKPKIFFFDDITSNLDSYNGEIIIDLIKNLKKKYTVIVVTNEKKIMELADEYIILRDNGEKK